MKSSIPIFWPSILLPDYFGKVSELSRSLDNGDSSEPFCASSLPAMRGAFADFVSHLDRFVTPRMRYRTSLSPLNHSKAIGGLGFGKPISI
jgi:hypothetical protein